MIAADFLRRRLGPIACATLATVCCAADPWRTVKGAGSDQRASAPAAVATIDVQQLMADVRTLSGPEFEGRLTGTAGNERARAFIVRRFRDLGLEPVAGAHDQTFFVTRRARATVTTDPEADAGRATNVMAVIRGTAERDRFTLLSAHFDHLGRRNREMYPGADDNASGVAGLLAAAAWFTRHPPRRSILLVAFDAEEQGLQGSRYFVKNPPVDLGTIVHVINLDMIGRGDSNTLWVAGTHHYPALKPSVSEASRGRRIHVAFGHDRPDPQAGVRHDWTHLSDHGPFHAAGIPFLYFAVEDHADYHKPTDTADKIPPAFYAEAVALVIDVLERLANQQPESAPPRADSQPFAPARRQR
jgi:hypothetical protein